MGGCFQGIRVLEVAQWVFVPAAGAVLADLGADVIKVEEPRHGDPYRGLQVAGLGTGSGPNLRVEQNNRGKRSLGLDLQRPEGRELLYRLAERSDVFLTNFRPAALRRLELDVEHLRRRNPRIIYARGAGLGVRGREAERPGYDASAFWARGGFAHALAECDAAAPARQRPALGDHAAAMNLAFGVAAALLRRERTGEAAVVDVSLLGSALWILSSDVTAAGQPGYREHLPSAANPNPLVDCYRTRDGRWIQLLLLQPDRYWSDLCRSLDRSELVHDVRFADADARAENRDACRALLEHVFASRTYAEWRERLAGFAGPWEPVQSIPELHVDPQVHANGYLVEAKREGDAPVTLVSAPVQIDGPLESLARAPETGEHTEELLLELGLSWEEIAALKRSSVVT